MLRIFEINFKHIAFVFFKMEFTIFCLFPFETRVWKRLTHRPAVEIVCVIIHDVVVVFLWVIIRSMRVVGVCMPFSDHTYAAMHAFFYEHVHADVC